MATNYLETINKLYEIERQRLNSKNTAGAATVAPASVAVTYAAPSYSTSQNRATNANNDGEKNKGKLLGGIGYLVEKAGAGLVSSIEGIWDFAAGGIAGLSGAERWAERQVANEWFGDWYDTAGDWYNAGSGWKVAGDIAGGIGTSVPALAGALAGGGVGIALAAGLSITSAGGSGVREAYDKTGNLSGKEWAYGAMSGATEGALETATNLLGAGIGGTVAKLGKVGGKAAAKTAATNVAKQGILKTAAITAGKSFTGEAFEEGVSAILNPQYAKLTYDPNAENATMQEIAYSAFVGGMAGVVMGGASSTYTEIKSRATANNLINAERDGEVFTLAKELIAKDDSDPIGTSIMRDVRGAYKELTESLEETNGKYTSGRQKYLLGRLNYLTAEATLNEATLASARHAIQNADAIAESLNSLGYTDANGNKITYTAEQIREGFKTEGIGKRRALQNALESNPILRMLSVADAANHLLMDTSAFNDQTLSGRQISSQKELNDYIEQASDATKSELGRALGIEDWSTANYTEVNKALASYLGDKNNVNAVENRIALKKEFEARRDARPLVVGRATAYAAKKDGIRRYKANGNDYAIAKKGDRYTLYDYKDKMVSNSLSLSELKAKLAEYDTKHGNAQESTKVTEGVSEAAPEQKTAQNGVKSNEEATKEKTAPEKEAEAVGEDVANFIEDVNKMLDKVRRSKRKKKIGKVSGNHAQIVESLMKKINPDFSAEGYELWIDGTGASHIEDRHGENGEHDHTMATHEAKSKIPWAAQNADSGEFLRNKDGSIRHSSRYFNSDGTKAPEIRLEKQTSDGTIYVSECVPDSANKIIWITSAYANKKGSKGQLLNMEERSSPQPTPKASLDGNATSNSIPDSAEKSNTISEKNSSSAKNPVVRSYDLAKTKVAKYDKLSANDQSMIRKIIRQGIALGVNEDVVIAAANIAARTHTDVVFNKDMCAVPTEDGLYIQGYANGAYYASEKRFYFNPEAQTTDGIIIHELDHAIRKRVGADGGVTTKLFKKAIDAAGKDTYTEVAKRYGKYTDTLKGKFAPEKYKSKWEKPSETVEEKVAETEDEVQAFYAETALKDKDILKHLLAEKPTLKDRILNFFKGAVTDYASVPALEADAKKYYKQYQKWFAEFEKAQIGTQINTRMDGKSGDVRHALPIGSENVAVKVEEDALYKYEKPITAKDIETLRAIGRKSINAFTSEDIEKSQKWAYKFYKEMGTKSPFFRAWFGDWRAHDTKTKLPIVQVNAETIDRGDVPRGDFKNEDTGWHITSNSDGVDETSNKEQKRSDSYHALKDIDALLKNAVLFDTVVVTDPSKRMGKNAALMHHMYCPVSVNGEIGVAKLYIAESLGDKHKFYLIRIEKASTAMGFNTENGESTPHSIAATDDAMVSVAQIFKFVKEHHEKFEKNSDHYVPFEPKPVNELMLNEDGTPKVFYHQTSEEFTVFDPRHKGAGTNDDETPFGIFMKPSDNDIGLKGKNQMPLYARITNPLITNDRADLVWKLKSFSSKYADLIKERNALANEYKKKIEDAAQAWSQYAKDYRKTHPNATRSAIYEDSEFKKLYDAEDILTEEWIKKADAISLQMKDEITKALKNNNYDGVILKNDSGSGGRVVETYIALDPTQVKSATDNIGTFDGTNADIRFSLPSDHDPNAPLLDENGKPIPYESYLDQGVPYAKSPEVNVGQMRKAIANATHYRVYSKKAMLDIVKQFPGADFLHAATRDKIADSMWQSFNSFKTTEEAESYIHDMARYILAVSMKEAKVQKPISDDAQRRFEFMRAYVNGLTFTKSDLQDIKSAKGEDGYKRIIGRWGYKARKNGKEHKTPMDVFVTDIAREMPEFADFESMTPVDAFLALDEAYAEAKATVNDKWQSIYEDATDADLEDMLGALEHELYTAFSSAGNVTAWRVRFKSLLDRYKKKSGYWKAQYDNENRYQRLKKMIEDDAVKLRDIKTRRFANATQFENDTLAASIGKLANVMYKGNLSVKKARQAASDLLVLYRSKVFRENILEYYDANQLGYYNEVIETYLEALAGNAELLSDMEGYLGMDEQFRENATKQGEKGFTKNELKMLEQVMSYFINFYKNYGKVWHRGHLVDAKPLADRFVGIAQGNKNVKELLLLRSVAGQWYKDNFLDPMSLMRMADGYERGFFTEMMEQSREAIIAAQFEEMTVMRKYDEFLEKNKKYLRDSSKETVKIRGHEITKNKLIDLYCTTKRDQAWRGLAINGYNYLDTKGKTVRVDGELPAGVYYDEHEIYAAVMRLQGEIEQHLTAIDLEYIEIIEEIYNVDSKRLKQERDFARQGFSNVEEGYYYPIRRGNIATNIDKAPFKEELDRVSNASFNKNTVEKAAQELCIDSADARLRRHVRAVCQYAHLSPVVEEFNRMYNYDISGNRDRPISVATETKNTWSNARDYWQKMVSDMQGISTRSEADGVLSYIRGGYAIAMLSMNPKVWLTQLSSFAAASGMLDASSIAGGGLAASREDIKNIGKYCPLADLRKYENTAALAQGVLDRRGVKVGVGGRAMGATRKFGEWGMKPIGAMDTFVINRLFGACMLQVEKNGGAKRGTEANKIAAGKLLTQLILETQQNSIATEKSAAMRSNSEILRTSTMFSADAMKLIGRCVDGFGEVRVIKSRLKNEEMTADVREQYTARLKIAKRKLRKALAALLVSAAYMAGVTALFKTLYNKWDKERKEDESRTATVAKSMSVDFAGNLIGGLPIIRDVYTKLFEGYDVDNYAYSAFNDVLNAGKKMKAIFDKDATSEETASAIKSLVYSTSSFSGIPARNMYNAVFGITKRISEPTAYKIDEVFYKKNHKTDLEKYIDQGDTKMADFMLDLLYDNGTTGLNASTMNSLRKLSELGYKVTPREVADHVTVDGEEYPISATEQSLIEEQYFANLKALDVLTASASYAKLTDEQRYYAVKSVLDVYYKKAVSDVMGTETTKSVLIASVIGAENMGVFTAFVKDYEDDVDKKGEKVSGTKRKKIVAAINAMPLTLDQKVLLMYAKGYTPKDGEIPGVSAESAKKRLLRSILNARDLTKSQKESLAKACGFTVKNGKISL